MHAADARNFLQITQEAMNTIGLNYTNFCDPADGNPNNFIGPGCAALQADDEGGNVVDTVLASLFAREVRRPFPFIFSSSSLFPNEQVILTEGLDDGECAAIVKEIQGVKVVVTPRVITTWIEPWTGHSPS